MKAHVFMASALLMAAIFFMRGLEIFAEPGLGLQEIYVLGGFCIAVLLFRAGRKERKTTINHRGGRLDG